jgi:hypothetical protein
VNAPLSESLDHLLAARGRSGRLGEHWPQGPVIASTEAVVGSADYSGQLREAQAAEVEIETVIRLVRRARVSVYARGPLPAASPAAAAAQRDRNRRVDGLIAGDNRDEPLTWADDGPTPAAVDRIAAAGYVAGTERVDAGRLLTALDGAFGGPSPAGIVAAEIIGVPAEALAGWLGDLACWFLAWDRRRREALAAGKPWEDTDSETALAETQREQAPLEAMLGSLDGQVLVGWYDTTVFGGYEDALPLGDAVGRYYSTTSNPSTDPPVPLVADRFAGFVGASEPRLPGADGGAVAAHVMRAAAALLYLGRRNGWLTQGRLEPGERPVEDLHNGISALEPHWSVAEAIGERFAGLLRAGLEGRPLPADWPRAT